MISLRVYFLGFATIALTSALVVACSDDESPSGASGPDASTPDGGGGGKDSATGEDGALREDSGADASDAACANVPLVVDGGGPCGTLVFGAAAAPFGGVDGGNTYAGGTFAPGIYDAVGAERASASGGSWRETFVVQASGRFTRIRQIDTGTGGGPGPISHRSGTVTANADTATFAYDCAETDGVAVDAGPDTLPFEVVKNACDATYRYGVTGIRITLRRRGP